MISFLIPGDKTQCLIDIIDYSKSPDNQLAQQAIKFAFTVLERGTNIKSMRFALFLFTKCTFSSDCLDVFKSVKKYRLLLEAVTLEHMNHIQGTELFEFLEIMAFRSLYVTHYDLGLPEITSACKFVGVIKDWVEREENQKSPAHKRYEELVEKFLDRLKRCIIDCWDSAQFVRIIPTLLQPFQEQLPVEDKYPPSIPLQVGLPEKMVNNKRKANRLMADIYDDWRTMLLAEGSLVRTRKKKLF